MPDSRRILLAHHAHHVIRKTGGGEPVFTSSKDFKTAIQLIKSLSLRHAIGIHAWIVVPDRIELLATVGENTQALSAFMKALACQTTEHHKHQHQTEDSPWEPHYRASPVESQWVLPCMMHVERQPVRLGQASSIYHHKHSSYRLRLGLLRPNWLTDHEQYRALGNTPGERLSAYRTHLTAGMTDSETAMIETAVERNKLTGSADFVKRVLERHGIDGTNRGRGRPRSRKPDDDAPPGEGGP